MNGIRVGFAMCGSFCTFAPVLAQAERLVQLGADVTPIMSMNASSLDTRFGKASDFAARLESICGKPVIKTIQDAEPIGPRKLLDLLLIAPCTGNTLAKLAGGITDTPVTLAAKAHLRNSRPIVIAVSTNDALAASAKNIGLLLNTRNIFFVPMRQDDTVAKPCSVVADFSYIPDSCQSALLGVQLQPVYL